MDRTACIESQCLYSIAIPLLPSVPVQYSYTSTPPTDRTDCTESQCPYKVALFIFLPLVSLNFFILLRIFKIFYCVSQFFTGYLNVCARVACGPQVHVMRKAVDTSAVVTAGLNMYSCLLFALLTARK